MRSLLPLFWGPQRIAASDTPPGKQSKFTALEAKLSCESVSKTMCSEDMKDLLEQHLLILMGVASVNHGLIWFGRDL